MNNRSTMRGIEESAVFMAIVDRIYMESAECLAQFEYARALRKPVMIVLCPGVDLPDLDGFGPSHVFMAPEGDWSNEAASAIGQFCDGLAMK